MDKNSQEEYLAIKECLARLKTDDSGSLSALARKLDRLETMLCGRVGGLLEQISALQREERELLKKCGK